MDFQIEERLRQIRKLKEESGEWISLVKFFQLM